ncbi:MAG: NnrU family protein, partial [Pseudomonadota bacterium]
AIGHLLANGELGSVVLFGAFLIWAIANRLSLSRRPDVAPPSVPLIQDIAAIAVAWVIYVLFMLKLHMWLFGVPPILI